MNLRQFFSSNNWWGKLLGAFFGYLIAGPAGALFGILIGNFFDKGLTSHFTRPHWSYYEEKRQAVRKIFFDTTFTVMGHIAKADGRVTENELDMARQMMREMRLNHEQKALAKRCFNEGKSSDFNLGQTLFQLKLACRDNPELLKLFLDIQYRSAKVDGLTEKKVQVLNSIFQSLGFAPLNQQNRFYEEFAYRSSSSQQRRDNSYNQRNYQPPPLNTLAQAYAILEVPDTAGKQEVKRAYRRLISRNHPDKLIAQGLPEEMIKLANDKTQKITKAYEQICESKGW
ncbi:co-chaperone DjlA [Legionella dresdenensis]|uniref:Co-chaperone protein DjlA n=1 Tax=Legionella dresdenensis TaxID=450200 RepID=A0ABV8CG21_9GAMM